jgi:chaperone LolA
MLLRPFVSSDKTVAMKLAHVLVFILFSFQLVSKACDQAHAALPPSPSILKEIFTKYKTAPAVTVDVKKKVLFALLDDEKQSSGQLQLSRGRLRLQIAKPDPSLLVVDNSTIWIETPASQELGSKPQVLKIVSKSFDKRSKSPLAILMGDESVWDEFKVKTQKSQGAVTEYYLEPKNKLQTKEIVQISLKVDEKDKLIRRIAYQDDIGNETSYQFENENFKAKFSDKDMQYTPPKGAEITEY